MSLVERIGIENVLNAVLVAENVRPAMLVQPQDYGERNGRDPKTRSIREGIKEYFPELSQSDHYDIYQGVIISKTKYNGEEITLNRMGHILGYPCYKDFETLDRDKIHYSITINAVRRNGKRIMIIANVCKDKKMLTKFHDFARQAEQAFQHPKYVNLLRNVEISEVEVIVETIVPDELIIHKLAQNQKLEQNEIQQMEEMLSNMGFSDETMRVFFVKCQYRNNPVHRGLLLSLLINAKHDILEPFTPLQDYPSEQKMVDDITKEWENNVLEILEKTKLPKSQRKTKKTKSHK